jgi:DNA modification methylase
MTGVAVLNTGRNFIGGELDPDYFRLAERRISSVR